MKSQKYGPICHLFVSEVGPGFISTFKGDIKLGYAGTSAAEGLMYLANTPFCFKTIVLPVNTYGLS